MMKLHTSKKKSSLIIQLVNESYKLTVWYLDLRWHWQNLFYNSICIYSLMLNRNTKTEKTSTNISTFVRQLRLCTQWTRWKVILQKYTGLKAANTLNSLLKRHEISLNNAKDGFPASWCDIYAFAAGWSVSLLGLSAWVGALIGRLVWQSAGWTVVSVGRSVLSAPPSSSLKSKTH